MAEVCAVGLTTLCILESLHHRAPKDRHCENWDHDLHKVGVAQHCRGPFDDIPGAAVAFKPRAQHGLRNEKLMLCVEVKGAVDDGASLQDVIIWDVHHVVAVLILIMPGCRLCEAIYQQPFGALIVLNVHTLCAGEVARAASVDQSKIPVCRGEVPNPPETQRNLSSEDLSL